MGLFKEFREFAVRGNAIDLAVGVVIGAAFGRIVDSLVKDVLMPPLGMLLGRTDFSNLFITLSDGASSPGPYHTLDAARAAGAVTLNVGMFVNTLISFTIIAFAIFIMIKAINQLQRAANLKEEAAAPTTRDCPYCLTAIPLKATRCPHCTSEVPPP